MRIARALAYYGDRGQPDIVRNFQVEAQQITDALAAQGLFSEQQIEINAAVTSAPAAKKK